MRRPQCGRSRAHSLLSLIELYHWLQAQDYSGYPARCQAFLGQCWEWLTHQFQLKARRNCRKASSSPNCGFNLLASVGGILMVMIIMISLKGANQDFSPSPHCAANCLQHIRSSGQGAVVYKSRATQALVMCNMCATWHKGTAQLLSLTEFKLHYVSFILLAETINWQRKEGNRSAQRKALTTSIKKYHMLKPKNSSPSQDSNPHSSTGGRLGKQICSPLHHFLEPCVIRFLYLLALSALIHWLMVKISQIQATSICQK